MRTRTISIRLVLCLLVIAAFAWPTPQAAASSTEELSPEKLEKMELKAERTLEKAMLKFDKLEEKVEKKMDKIEDRFASKAGRYAERGAPMEILEDLADSMEDRLFGQAEALCEKVRKHEAKTLDKLERLCADPDMMDMVADQARDLCDEIEEARDEVEFQIDAVLEVLEGGLPDPEDLEEEIIEVIEQLISGF